jgi:hypothetical protein
MTPKIQFTHLNQYTHTHTHTQIFYNSDEAQKSVSKNQFTHLNQHRRVSEISTTDDEAQKSGCSYKSTEFHTSYYKHGEAQKSQFAHLLNRHRIFFCKTGNRIVDTEEEEEEEEEEQQQQQQQWVTISIFFSFSFFLSFSMFLMKPNSSGK